MPFMDFTDLLHYAYECLYFIVVFGVFTVAAIAMGRQAIINIIVGLYLALLISMNFPYYDTVQSFVGGARMLSVVKLGIFFAFTVLAVWLFYRIMPPQFRETKFESFGKKILLAFAATVLVMIFSFNVLPVTEFLSPGTPIQSLFAPEGYFFWWLMLPLVFLFVL